MTSVSEMASKVQKFTADNSPVVLTAIGAAGVVTTAIFAAKGSFKAAKLIEEELPTQINDEGEETDPYTMLDKVKVVWPCYIPAVTSGVLTCTAIIASSQISNRRAAAMAAAYSLSEKRINEYRDKVVEKFGEKKEGEVREEILTEQAAKEYSPDSIVMGTGEQLCYDGYTGRFFKSTMEDLKAGMNRVNYDITHNGYASLSDFYYAIGLEPTSVSDELGWNGDKLLDIHFTTILTPDNRPAIAMEYRSEPIRNYFRMG